MQHVLKAKGLDTSIKGPLTALEEYLVNLESMSLAFFLGNKDKIRMGFIPRVSEGLTDFERNFIPELKCITDFESVYSKDSVVYTIKDKPKSKSFSSLIHSKLVSQTNFNTTEVKTGRCKDCKGTGIYQPLIGPAEPCLVCSSESSCLETVANLFTRKLYNLLGSKIKTYKSINGTYTHCGVEFSTRKGGPAEEYLADSAAKMLVKTLAYQYSGQIAFENLYSNHHPVNTLDTIHQRSNYSGVYASVSMRTEGNDLQFQFQVRVSS